MTITYSDQLKDYVNFESAAEFKKAFNLFRKKHRFEITDAENKVLFTMTGYAVKFTGACKLQLETIAAKVGVSVTTVKRAIAKAVKLGILKRFKTRKTNGSRQGATVYQFQRFELENELQNACHSQDVVNASDSKAETQNSESEALISLSPSLKNLKDTNITAPAHAFEKEAAKRTLKDALLDKIPAALKPVGLFFDDVQKLYDLNGVIFNAKDSVCKDVRIEEHTALFSKTVKSVYEYWKRQVRNGKPDYNVFGLMRKAIKELTERIVNGIAYETPKVRKQQNKHGRKEVVPQFMIDDEQDPVRKAELQAESDAALRKVNAFKKQYNCMDVTEEEQPQLTTDEFEKAREEALKRLASL